MSLNNDTDTGERARALHRVVRAMHDGECPKCHKLFASEKMTYRDAVPRWGAPGVRYWERGHRCPDCDFTITQEESEAALQEFAGYMDQNLAVFEAWRKERRDTKKEDPSREGRAGFGYEEDEPAVKVAVDPATAKYVGEVRQALATDTIGGFSTNVPFCRGCSKTLTIENAWMTDGCPCNSPLGINSMNEMRWRLLMSLQQQQSRELEALKANERKAPEPLKAGTERIGEKADEDPLKAMGIRVDDRGHLALAEDLPMTKAEQEKQTKGDDAKSRAYVMGERATWLKLLKLAYKELGYSDHGYSGHAAIDELERVRAALRKAHRDFGADWPDEMQLDEVLERLMRSMHVMADKIRNLEQ